MGMFDKLRFWKKGSDDILSGPPLGLHEAGDMGLAPMGAQQPEQRIDDLGGFGTPQRPSAFQDMRQYQQSPQQSDLSSQKLDVISGKLDIIKASLDNLNQRLERLEKLAGDDKKGRW